MKFWLCPKIINCIDIYPRILATRIEVFCLFFGRIENKIICFWILKSMFSKKCTKRIWNLHRRFDVYLVSVKLTVKILSFFVAFLENMNFKKLIHIQKFVLAEFITIARFLFLFLFWTVRTWFKKNFQNFPFFSFFVFSNSRFVDYGSTGRGVFNWGVQN